MGDGEVAGTGIEIPMRVRLAHKKPEQQVKKQGNARRCQNAGHSFQDLRLRDLHEERRLVSVRR